jgi:hypothetical protein
MSCLDAGCVVNVHGVVVRDVAGGGFINLPVRADADTPAAGVNLYAADGGLRWKKTNGRTTTITDGGEVDRVFTMPVDDGEIVNIRSAQTLTNKTFTRPSFSQISNGGATITVPMADDTIVCRNTTDVLTNKTLTLPVISRISNVGTLTLPTTTDTLVGRVTTDTLTNKTIDSANNILRVAGVEISAAISAAVTAGGGSSGSLGELVVTGTTQTFGDDYGRKIFRWTTEATNVAPVTILTYTTQPNRTYIFETVATAYVTAGSLAGASGAVRRTLRVANFDDDDKSLSTGTLEALINVSASGLNSIGVTYATSTGNANVRVQVNSASAQKIRWSGTTTVYY